MQMEKIMLDYDEKSVISTYDQTADKKEVFKGVEVAMLSQLVGCTCNPNVLS